MKTVLKTYKEVGKSVQRSAATKQQPLYTGIKSYDMPTPGLH